MPWVAMVRGAPEASTERPRAMIGACMCTALAQRGRKKDLTWRLTA